MVVTGAVELVVATVTAAVVGTEVTVLEGGVTSPRTRSEKLAR
jgi:hypothetical protein